MAKKRKVRWVSNASKRARSGKAIARRSDVKTTKKKKMHTPSLAASKRQKPKPKRRARLSAKGGGNATAAGVSFQASVGAVFAVQMLTESFGDEQFGLPPFKVRSIRFESDAPLDDIVVETDQGGWLFVQAKTKLSLSKALTSKFGKTAQQIIRQWHAGLAGKEVRGWDRTLNLGRDRLILAVGPGTSQTITSDLVKALSSLRARATAPLPAKQRAVLRKLSAALKAAWKAVTGRRASDADIAVILPLIAVVRFDMAGSDRSVAIAQMRLLTLQAASAHGAFVATERQSQALMERRHGADAKAFRNFIAQAGISLKAAPSYQADVAQLKLLSSRIAAELDAFKTTVIDQKSITISAGSDSRCRSCGQGRPVARDR